MKVVVREAAAGDLDDIRDWISRDNPRAAAELGDTTLPAFRTFLLSQKCLERFNRRCGRSKQMPGS